MSKGYPPLHWEHAAASGRKCCIGFFAAFHWTFLYARFPLPCTVTYILLNTDGAERSLAGRAVPLIFNELGSQAGETRSHDRLLPMGRSPGRCIYGADAGKSFAATPEEGFRGRVVGDRGKLLIPEPHAS